MNQDGNQIEILDENGKRITVPKTNVLKVVYKEHSEQELAERQGSSKSVNFESIQYNFHYDKKSMITFIMFIKFHFLCGRILEAN